MLYKTNTKFFISIIILVLFLILGLWISDFNFFIHESYINNQNDGGFYLSDIRTRDYQDVISITESQLIKTN